MRRILGMMNIYETRGQGDSVTRVQCAGKQGINEKRARKTNAASFAFTFFSILISTTVLRIVIVVYCSVFCLLPPRVMCIVYVFRFW